jgi:L-asparagine oxygenase
MSSAWAGSRRSIWASSPTEVVVRGRDARTLAGLALTVTASPAREPERFCSQAREAASGLPAGLASALDRFAEAGSDTGTLLVHAALPGDEPPPTPPDNTRHVGAATPAARAQAILNHRLGEMVAYEAEGEGRLFQDMVPSRAAAMIQTSLSSGVELELHTEQAFSRLRPDFVSLGCLRGDPRATTYVFPARRLVGLLAPAELEALRSPHWVTEVDESFRLSGTAFEDGDLRGPMPILSGPPDDPRIVLDQHLMRGTTARAQRLLDRVVALYLANRGEHVLGAGDVLLLDNLRTVHGRSPFAPRFDGRDRFVLRSFVVRDLGASAHARPRGGRTIGARFS